MHDWTLLSILHEWKSSEVKLTFITNRTITARGVSNLHVPQLNEWGPSVSVNKARMNDAGGMKKLEIEMQSGDVIVVEAKVINFPHGAKIIDDA